MDQSTSSASRAHVVLVPGFAGFDALGQMEYYAGTTALFRAWKREHSSRARVVLHYFDNLPTAGVVTRAARLRAYLTKRIARGELQEGDTVALVGHSTGGLDIRRMVWELTEDSATPLTVDGARSTATEVAPDALLGMIKCLVFLSVPQWGTNIADWVGSYPRGRRAIVAEMRALVAAAQVPPIDRLEQRFAGHVADLARADAFRAVQDALREIDTKEACEGGPTRVAAAQEAASELALYLLHAATDFAAIDDLSAGPCDAQPRSPAHFDAAMRAQEIARWKQHGIETRSYATVGTRPFEFREGSEAPLWELSDPETYPGFKLRHGMRERTDIAYRISYRACAGGPFRYPDGAPFSATRFGSSTVQKIELWDNDGIVNTASMLWPDGTATQLVEGDHGDIVGHYRLLDALDGDFGRKSHTYDLLRSDSGFATETFEKVWGAIFSFCAPDTTAVATP